MEARTVKLAIAAVMALGVIGAFLRVGHREEGGEIPPHPMSQGPISARRGAPQAPGEAVAAGQPQGAIQVPRQPAVADRLGSKAPSPALAAVAPVAPEAPQVADEPLPEDIRGLGHVAVNDAKPQRRIEAIHLLTASEDPQAIPFLRQTLSDPDASVRFVVVKTLAEADFPGNAQWELIDTVALHDTEEENRLEALDVLAKHDPQRAAAIARQALNDSEENVRDRAQEILDAEEESPPEEAE